MKRAAALIFVLAFFCVPQVSLSTTGQHLGDKQWLEYEVSYLDPKGVTTAHDFGIDFIPNIGSPTYSNEILPEVYWREYPLYFTGDEVHFRVSIYNTGKRTYRNLHVIATQELLNTEGGAGQTFPGDSTSDWFVEKIGPGQDISLEGSFVIPTEGVGVGIDQTHLSILHGKGSQDLGDEPHKGRVMLDDPQAGLWCPTFK